MICILGDIHFNASKDYFRATCEAFLEWFKNWDKNNSNNSLILAGDLVQDSVNGGIVIKYLEQLYQYSSFREVHIVVGNHDLKKVNNISQLAYEFYKEKPNFFVYEEATEVTIDNHRTLLLPYYVGVNKYGISMADYYSNIHKNNSFKNNYDLVVGHFCGEDASFPGAIDCIRNLDKLSGRICLGHIHTRNLNPSRYIGSVYAGRRNENDFTRAAWILNSDNSWEEEKLPIFNEFITIDFPEPLVETKAIVPVYTILNCSSEATAKETYGNIFLRKTTSSNSDVNKKSEDNLERQFSNIKNMNMKDLFEEYVMSQNLEKSIVSRCKKALKLA